MPRKSSHINLIIVDDSFDTEEKVISTLRTLGYATRSSRVEDDEDLIDAMKAHQPDLVLYSQGMELISLKETCKIIKDNTNDALIPVIAVDKKETEANVTEAISAGAMDLSSYENMKHLTQVINREVRTYRNWKQNQSLQKSMEETERRCDSLLDSSRDAIAYVHEGRHVYSHDSYLELFDITWTAKYTGKTDISWRIDKLADKQDIPIETKRKLVDEINIVKILGKIKTIY